VKYDAKMIIRSEVFVRKGIASAIQMNLPPIVDNRLVRRIKEKLLKEKKK